MKFLESTPELDILARALNFAAPGVKVSSRVEAYTIKPLARDRALFKRLDAETSSNLHVRASSPLQTTSTGASIVADGAFSTLDGRENRRTLWLLIGTLNLAHPDHDFTNLTAADFVREPSSRVVLSQLSTALGHLRQSGSAFVASSSPPKYSTSFSSLSSSAGTNSPLDDLQGPSHPILRQVLDPIIDLDDCEVYSYAPDFDSDPHNGESDSEGEADDGGSSVSSETEGDVSEGLAWPMDGVPRSSPRHARRRPGGITPQASPLVALGAAKRSLSMLSLNESTGGLLWSSNYFFLNRKKKKLLFISLWARATEGGSFALGSGFAAHMAASLQAAQALEPPVKRVRCAV